MSWCERILTAHVDCVKDFIYQAREKELVYAPGSYAKDIDRCMNTRQAYVDCVHDPNADKNTPNRVVSMETSTGVQPLNAHGGKNASGKLAKDDLSRNWTILPKACGMELVMHGKCVENEFRRALKKNDEYVFLSGHPDVADNCFLSRASFDQCMVSKREREAAGPDPQNNVRPRQGVSRSFSSRGRWVELE